MLEIIKEEGQKGNQISAAYFIGHSEEQIRKEAIDLISNKYEISSNWHEKHLIFVATEKDNLSESGRRAILRFKRIAIRVMMQENSSQLKQLSSDASIEEVTELLKIKKELKNVDREICLELGIVIG